jgi:hypothetical protein
MTKERSREYLEEALAEARKLLPGWAFAMVHRAALPRAGGRASARSDEPSALEKIALVEIRPARLREISDQDLRVTWLRLNQWFANFKRRRQPVEDVVNAALWTLDEFKRRNFDAKPSPLVDAAEALRSTRKEASVHFKLEKLPRDMVVVRDFVSVVGSTAKGKENPGDIDLLVRAPQADGGVLVQTENVWLPIRNVLDPEKSDALSFLFNAQGPHGDHVPVFDLVLRRKDEIKTAVVKDEELAFHVKQDGPLVAFVGQQLGEENSEIFKSLYLDPLETRAEQIALADMDGEPTTLEIAESRKALFDRLDDLEPRAVVALGKAAKRTLGKRADMFMPHPEAVRKFGDRGEVGRKIRQLKRKLQQVVKQRGEEGGDPESSRGANTQRNWQENWHKFLPKSGKGRFVYQHHWRGLDTDETKLSDAELLKTDNSLHGDIRFEGADELFGWAVLIGKAGDNARTKQGDKLLSGQSEIRLAPKLQQPKAWLDIGKGSGTVLDPGDPGATTEAHAKLFIRDSGTYRLGVAQRNSVEVFLDGSTLQGRYLITFPELEPERRVWLIDKPEDQTPRAETEDLADVAGELKRKGRKFLIWSKPGERPRKIDVRTSKVEKSILVPISKADEEKRIIYAVVLDPYGRNGPETDAHNDWIPPAHVEDTAHKWMEKSGVVSLHHKGPTKSFAVESWIEQYPPGDHKKAMRGSPHRVFRRKFGEDTIHSGAWVLGTKLSDADWAAFKAGEIGAYSIEGLGHRTEASRAVMPEVKFVDLVSADAS